MTSFRVEKSSPERYYYYDIKKGILLRYHKDWVFHSVLITPFIFNIEDVRDNGYWVFNGQIIDTGSELKIPLEDVRINDVLNKIRMTGRINNPEHFSPAVKVILNQIVTNVWKCEHGGEMNFKSRTKTDN
jgi:hypothetical protein